MIAQKAIEEKDVQKAHDSIIRAQDILNEFKATLDMRYEISHNLNLLYDYFLDRLIEANIRKDIPYWKKCSALSGTSGYMGAGDEGREAAEQEGRWSRGLTGK